MTSSQHVALFALSLAAARIINAQEFEGCTNCEQNGGYCLATTDDMNALQENFTDNYECKCPVTQVQDEEGADCAKSLGKYSRLHRTHISHRLICS